MRMLRTNQSKITGPNHAARVNVSRNAFLSSQILANISFVIFDIVIKKKTNQMGSYKSMKVMINSASVCVL